MLQQKATYAVFASLFLANVIYGCWPLLARIALNGGLDPLVFALYRAVGASVLLLIISYVLEDPVRKISRSGGKEQIDVGLVTGYLISGSPLRAGAGIASDYARFLFSLPWPLLCLLGLLICLSQVGMIVGIALTSSSQAALMQTLIPVVTCFASVAAGTELAHTGKFVGVLISVTGAMFVIYAGESEAAAQSVQAGRLYLLGTLALTVSVLGNAFFVVVQKVALRTLPPVFLVGMSTLIGAGYLAVFVPFYVREMYGWAWWRWALTPTREVVLAYAVFLTNGVNLALIAWANKATNPGIVTTFNTLQPLVASGMGVVCYGVYPHHRTLMGGAVIITGLLVAVTAQLQHHGDGENLSLICDKKENAMFERQL